MAVQPPGQPGSQRAAPLPQSAASGGPVALVSAVAKPPIQQVAAISATVAPPIHAQAPQNLTIKAQQVANKCDRFAIGILGRSGAYNKHKIPADKEQALKNCYVKLRGMLVDKGLVPNDVKGFAISPELLLARYVDKDGIVKEVSLLDIYSATEVGVADEDSFKKTLDHFDFILREALDLLDPSDLSSFRSSSIPLPAMRRSWDDLELIGIKQKIEDLRTLSRSQVLTPQQTATLKDLEFQEAKYTLLDEKKFPKDLNKILNISSIATSAKKSERTKRAKAVYDALQAELKQRIEEKELEIVQATQTSADSTDNQKVLAQLKQLQYRLHEVDLFALHAALACAPDVFDENSVKNASSKIRTEMDSYYKGQRDIHRKERTDTIKKRKSFWDRFRSPAEKVHPIAEYNRYFAADIGGLVFSANVNGLDSEKLRTDYYKACNLPLRERSCIDDLFDAVMSKELNDNMADDAIAYTLLNSGSFSILPDADKNALKDAVANALQ